MIFLDTTFSFHELGYYFAERQKLQTSRSKAATQDIVDWEKLIYLYTFPDIPRESGTLETCEIKVKVNFHSLKLAVQNKTTINNYYFVKNNFTIIFSFIL